MTLDQYLDHLEDEENNNKLGAEETKQGEENALPTRAARGEGGPRGHHGGTLPATKERT